MKDLNSLDTNASVLVAYVETWNDPHSPMLNAPEIRYFRAYVEEVRQFITLLKTEESIRKFMYDGNGEKLIQKLLTRPVWNQSDYAVSITNHSNSSTGVVTVHVSPVVDFESPSELIPIYQVHYSVHVIGNPENKKSELLYMIEDEYKEFLQTIKDSHLLSDFDESDRYAQFMCHKLSSRKNQQCDGAMFIDIYASAHGIIHDFQHGTYFKRR